VPLLEALAHSRNSLTGLQWRRKADLIVGDVRSGKSLADAMQAHHFVDAIGLNLIRVGERSGALPKTVASLAALHRASSEQSLKQFLVLLEPLTILMVSVLLGGIMISVMVAITSLTNVI
jgi:general secretion pathway protein F